MPRRERYASGFGEAGAQHREAGCSRHALQVAFEQSRSVSRIVRVLKSREPVTRDQGQQAQQALLIRRRHQHGPARFHDASQAPDECPRVLEMLNRLDRGDHVCRSRLDRPVVTVEIHGSKLESLWEPLVADGVEAAGPR